MTIGEALLCPTRIYVKSVLATMKAANIHGIAHITGGGFIENIPRIIPDGLCAEVELEKCPHPPLFDLIRKTGELDRMEMYNIFNMGVGMVMAVPEREVNAAIAALEQVGEKAYVIGRIPQGQEKVALV